ncbi:F0F1 ATP synthase subunit epsilon [Roseobacter sp. HKCCD9010]|uniref:F0F1 ATP synthase subunit epsilon n=1 Tax=unclassified Roseobacter TaxID=196798 RepID=UPI0014909C07|nr:MULTISPECIES: F0F1 ATP synthase subunit epsilon [unclassified Roseobacter]MBF9051219.1 F0F1 ATP synthase subunit epsilon [Rhodobacterales bacterium HKCCD4356]NNV13266.1 F0F1 ATP synthase subunit epsilon [Roseobacter sp. HKCCD7357]NNV17517.1 F0F1 ATP synthase subunit epsilon [Roseobacter sp. HKCCD8768]NNV27123.1 F0F1 ATP synthase subunit epsilon [Roseobacter sp. HKCCD8192]NNV31243.1 F0F1 ATP synthase subunit epsilon [Roseobacter sp. HKCCD9061]
MADMMQFDMVSPERRLASVQAKSVQIPGVDGDMTAMPDHAPMITTLRPGVLSVETATGETMDYIVVGGFADVSGAATTVLAERALPKDEVTAEMLDGFIAEAREAHAKASDTQVHGVADAAAKLLADMEALKGHINL